MSSIPFNPYDSEIDGTPTAANSRTMLRFPFVIARSAAAIVRSNSPSHTTTFRPRSGINASASANNRSNGAISSVRRPG